MLGFFVQLHEGSIGAAVFWNGIGGHPVCVDVAIEILCGSRGCCGHASPSTMMRLSGREPTVLTTCCRSVEQAVPRPPPTRALRVAMVRGVAPRNGECGTQDRLC